MTRHSLALLTALVSIAISGCSSDSTSAESSVTAPVPFLDDSSLDDSRTIELSEISHDFEILQFTSNVQNEFNDGVFFDGPGLLDQGFQLLQELKSSSKQTFENLNMGFAEGTVPSDVLECSLYNESNVIHGFACTEEVDETVLDNYGSGLFLITVENVETCAALPLGAFNEVDCQISAFNFLSDSGRYGYYRSFRENGEVYRESLTVTSDNVPSFVDPTTLPETCVLEVYREGTVLLNDSDACTNAINELLNDLRT